MKKFFRNLFSGYFFIIIFLLVELALIIFFEFFFETALELTFSALSADGNDTAQWIATGVYMGIRLVAFIIALIISTSLER